jgi:hypothetical protein
MGDLWNWAEHEKKLHLLKSSEIPSNLVSRKYPYS